MESLPGLVKVGMWLSFLGGLTGLMRLLQCSPPVQFSPQCNPVVKTRGLVIKLSEWRLERVLFNFPANIVSRPVFWLIGELGGGNLVSVTCGARH